MSFRLRERRQIALSNHKKLLSAIKKKDSKLAKKLILDTISRSKAILLEEITD
jgi:DNA-binding GntR family transcriptional regulator